MVRSSPRVDDAARLRARPPCVCVTRALVDSPRTRSPLRSSFTKRLITAYDYAAVQINVGDVDPSTGRYTNTSKTYAICGYIRAKVRRRPQRRLRARVSWQDSSPPPPPSPLPTHFPTPLPPPLPRPSG